MTTILYKDIAKVSQIPTKTSQLTNDSNFVTSTELATKQDKLVAGTNITIEGNVISATGGSGGVSVDWSDILNKPTFATVATSGSYNDLSDKPTIPTVDYPVTDVTVGGVSVLSNKVATIPALFDGNYDSLKNKPDLSVYALSSSLSTVATSGSYNDLTNKPTIPTTTSQLTNDSNFITSSDLAAYATINWVVNQDYQTSSDVSTAVSTAISSQTKETWTFEVDDGAGGTTTVTKSIVLGE